MASFNKVILMGNLTRDIELRYTPGGTAVADVGLAVNRARKGNDGEKIEEVTFVDVTLWGRTAEVVHEYSGKGEPLHVEGRLQMESWEDKDTGAKRSRLKVIGENIQLLTFKKGKNEAADQGGGGSGGGGGSSKPPLNPERQMPGVLPDSNQDDIPF